LNKLFDCLVENNLTRRYTHILTGYARSATFLEKVADIVKKVKSTSPGCFYVCDPVMGDNGKMVMKSRLFSFFRF
jgi:pyridoxine kinase